MAGATQTSVDRDLVGTCAFLTAYLAGVPATYLEEVGVARGFQVIVSTGQDRRVVWDPKRSSYVHVRPEPDNAHWRLYDFASARHLRVERSDDEFNFADEGHPTWSLRTRPAGQMVQVVGPLGEQRYQVGTDGA
jgi:hypothetical protein